MSNLNYVRALIESTIASLVRVEAEAKEAEDAALDRYREASGIRQPYTNDIQSLCAARDTLPGYIENPTALERCRDERRRREMGA